ncbi:GGDEF domain-containing protein [Roseiarcaceae bacterium H3SJ34-1]|uniref:GGDEF domain-containing protein n=1 Tax=Terripilifer ovatus TaxID=3032367 RepID=UPI003AB9964F|nr:GGDEF domain-containing protein [Roseiarcaceae bacterium H3SJ34-1]
MPSYMNADSPTLISYTTVLIALMGGVFTLFWSREKQKAPLFWFVLPFLFGVTGAAITINPAFNPGGLGPRLGVFFILLAYGFAWQAVRALYRRRRLVLPVLLPSLLWLILSSAFRDKLEPPIPTAAMRMALLAAFNGLAAYEFWRHAEEGLPSSKTLFWVFAIYAVLNAARIPVMTITPMPIGLAPTEIWAVIVYNLASVILALLVTTFMIVLARDRQSARNYSLVLRDALTNVYNRRAYHEHMQAFATNGDHPIPPYALLVFDIDHFKSINDRFGHQTGDKVIILAAQAAGKTLRKHDKVFRIGGEEFVCLLPDTTMHQAYDAAERLRAAFRELTETVDGKPIGATISIGVAATDGVMTADEIFAHADAALYQAKTLGRNRTVMASPSVSDRIPGP